VRPYYDHAGITIFHGDCREVLPSVEQPDTCITDPVWPNSVFPGVADPAALFAETCNLLTCARLVVHLGCSSDPRFLAGVPERYPPLRVVWLRYARPSYRARLLIGSDVAYAFGEAPRSRPGRRVLPGEYTARNNSTKTQHTRRGDGGSEGIDYANLPHPSPRRLEHLTWLVGVFADDGVIDPFCGTGTTLLAAKNAGLQAIGIEIEERYCEIAAKRLSQEVLPLAATGTDGGVGAQPPPSADLSTIKVRD
jgi:site-specific DNA-methyltransferase (adenine-specific)